MSTISHYSLVYVGLSEYFISGCIIRLSFITSRTQTLYPKSHFKGIKETCMDKHIMKTFIQ